MEWFIKNCNYKKYIIKMATSTKKLETWQERHLLSMAERQWLVHFVDISSQQFIIEIFYMTIILTYFNNI